MDAYPELERQRVIRRGWLPEPAQCRICGCREVLALAVRVWGVVCYECLCEARGNSRFEEHHLAGGHIGPSVRLGGNSHRTLSAMQLDRPTELATLPLALRLGWGIVEMDDLLGVTRPNFLWTAFVPHPQSPETWRGPWKREELP